MGRLPTLAQFDLLIDTLEKYTANVRAPHGRVPTRDHQTVAEGQFIGEIEGKVATGKPRNYLVNHSTRAQDAERRYIRTAAHLGQTLDLLANLRRMRIRLLEQWPDIRPTDRIPWTFGDIGWTFTPARRRSDHETHSSSIDLMNLIDAIARTLLGNDCRIRYNVLYQPLDFEHIAMSEHLITRLTHAYAGEGGGFNRKCAGISKSSGVKLAAYWRTVRQEAIKRGVFPDNLLADLTRMETVCAQFDDATLLADRRQSRREQYRLFMDAQNQLRAEIEKLQDAVERLDEILGNRVPAAVQAISIHEELDAGYEWMYRLEKRLKKLATHAGDGGAGASG